jgi:hypothetical protein
MLLRIDFLGVKPGRSRGSLGRKPQQPRSFQSKKSEVDRPNVPFVRPNLGYEANFSTKF